VPALAATLRAAAPEGRVALAGGLTPVAQAVELVAHAFALGLGDSKSATARDAADVAEAVGELEPRREVAREARRSRIRLRSAGIMPSFAVPHAAATSALARTATPGPAPTVATPPASAPPASSPAAPRLVEAYVTRTREQGEVTLVLGWQDSFDSAMLRGQLFRLSFWDDGVRDFVVSDAMSRTRFQRELLEGVRTEAGVPVVPITWAQARRLVLDALDVNAWRGTEPAAEFQTNRAQIESRLLVEPVDPDLLAQIAAEAERLAREGDRPFISGGMEPDETLANWIGAWSFGDFALTYDLLADDHPLRRTQTRQEYVALRRLWAKEAAPSNLRLTLIREQEQRASALWVPGGAGVIGGGERKEMEAFWSLALRDVQEAGQLDEMPLATLTSTETGRHWYWTGYTVARDRAHDLWLLTRSRDEGAASQALTIEELQRRIKEAHDTVERITQQPAPDPRSEEAAEALRTITGALTASLHYSDALNVRLPLDEAIYRAAITDARTLGNHERAAALIERMQGRFADEVRLRFELGIEQYLVAEQYGRTGQGAAEASWLDRAIATLTGVVEAEPTAEHLQGLGELLARQGHFNQAETRLREAIRIEPERAMLHSDLADTLMGRISGENLDDPVALTPEERRSLAREALAALRRLQELDPAHEGIFTRMGAIYELLEQNDDALLAFEEAVKRDPGDAAAHYALGAVLLSRRQPDRALSDLETAVQLAPIALPYRVALASCYAALDRVGEATRELDTVDKLQPGLPQVAELRTQLARRKKQR
jgi:tetratricopeptide (TPR) repeat protein